MLDKKYFRFLILTISAVLLCISLHISASAYSYYDDDGYLTFENNDYDTNYLYYRPLSAPVVSSSVEVPSGYQLVAYSVNSSAKRSSWYYYPSTYNPMYCYQSSSGTIYIGQSSVSGITGFRITNDISNDGTLSYLNSGTFGSISIGLNTRLTAFIPCIDNIGNITRPENQVIFNLNTAFIGDNLTFNCTVNSGDASSVSYYFFPASAPISGGSTSSVVSPTPVNQITEQQKLSFFDKGFQIVGQLIQRYGEVIESIGVPKVSLNTSISVRSSSLFNPDSYNVSYEYLGVGRLFSVNSTNVTPSGSISIKDILSRNSGVYAYQQLKLVAVCTLENRSFVAAFDFNPSAINDGAPVAPNSLIPSASYPTFGNTQSDFKELADYLKDLYETQNMNDKRNNNNLLAMLTSIPWAQFVGTGFSTQLPNLSFYLDSLFDSLFDKYTAPSDEDINILLNEINSERAEIRGKLSFVTDVKEEYLFIITTITADNNDTPPDFHFNLPSMWSGGQTIRVKLLSYEIATPEIMVIIKQIITVFLSLALLLHIWRTLPSTIGNMPASSKGDN